MFESWIKVGENQQLERVDLVMCQAIVLADAGKAINRQKQATASPEGHC